MVSGVDAKEKTVQKEIKGIKHFGVIILARDLASHSDLGQKLSENVISGGFMQYVLTVKDEATGKNRKWTFSDVFNIVK